MRRKVHWSDVHSPGRKKVHAGIPAASPRPVPTKALLIVHEALQGRQGEPCRCAQIGLRGATALPLGALCPVRAYVVIVKSPVWLASSMRMNSSVMSGSKCLPACSWMYARASALSQPGR